MIVNKQLSKNY